MITRCIVETIAAIVFGILTLVSFKISHKKKRDRSSLGMAFLILFVCIMASSIFTWHGYSLRSQGLKYEAAGNYAMALEAYQEARGWAGYAFTDLEECANRVYYPAKYAEATELYKQKEYASALIIFLELGDYGNSKTCVENCMRAYLESQ